MKKRYYKNPAFAVFLRIAAAVLAVWLVCMTLLTVITARLYTELFADDIRGKQDEAGTLDWTENNSATLTARHGMLELRLNGLHARYDSENVGSKLKPLLEENAEYQSGTVVFSPDGEPMLVGGSGYMAFTYVVEYENIRREPGLAGYIDLTALDIDAELWAELDSQWDTALKYNWPYMFELTGHFTGYEFIPSRIDFASGSSSPGNRKTIYESDRELSEEITVWSTDVYYQRPQDAASVEYKGAEYANPAQLIVKQGELFAANGGNFGSFNSESAERFSLREVLMFDASAMKLSREVDPQSPTLCYVVSAMRTEPMRTAVGALKKVYILSFALAALLIAVVAFWISRHFIYPVHISRMGAVDGWGYVSTKLNKPIKWRDAAELREILQNEREKP